MALARMIVVGRNGATLNGATAAATTRLRSVALSGTPPTALPECRAAYGAHEAHGNQ